MRLSPHFTLEELCKSPYADRKGLHNFPETPDVIENLEALALNVLEVVRSQYGPFSPSSGYRSPQVNSGTGGSVNSQHMRGEAADFEIVGVDNVTLACWIRDNVTFDRLILEYYIPGVPTSGWVHVSFSRTKGNRNEVLTKNKGGAYVRGIH